MAWSWPWSRDKAPPTSAPSVAQPAATPAPVAAPAPSPMGWAFLPPIQRQLAEPIRPLSRGFEPGAWASPMFTGAMTHAVADGAPHGLIDGDGRGLGLPIQRSAAGPELTLLPPPRPRAQRSIQRATDEELEEHDAGSADTWQPEAWSTADAATGDGPDEGGTGGEGRAQTPMTVSRAAESRTPAAAPEPPRSLVRASPVGLPFVQRSAVAVPVSSPAPSQVSSTGSSTVAPGSTPATADQHAPDSPMSERPVEVTATGPTLSGISTLTPGSPAAESLGVAGAPSPMPGTPTALPMQRLSSSAPAPAAGRAVAGERPRLGFGPPLEQVPSTAQSSPPPDLPGPALQAQRAAADGFTEVALPGVGVAAPKQPSAPKQPPAPGMPLQRASSPDMSPTVASAAADEPSPAAAEAIHPEDCADPGHGHPAAAPPAAVPPAAEVAGPPDVVPTTEAVVPEPLASPAMRGEVAPLNVGGLSTSIQRSSVLPGPGLPVQRLSVRPAGLPAVPSSRVVRVQRVPSSMSTPSSSAGTTTPSPTPTGATYAATSPAPTSTLTPMGGATSLPALQRSTATSASPSSLPVVDPVGQGGMLDAGAAAVSVEYAAVPFESGTGMGHIGSSRAGPSVAGSSPAGLGELGSVAASSDLGSGVAVSSDLGSGTTGHGGYGGSTGAGPASFVQRSSAGVASAPALRAPGLPAAPSLVLPQRASAAEIEAVESATIQRAEAPEAPEPEPAPPPAEAADAGSPAAAPPAAAPPAAGGQQSPEQAEAMARQLFPSLLRMLRGELVVDRERRGVRTDRW